jgi:phage terminase large subunit-like protein
MTPSERALQYAEDVTGGKILAGKYTVLACQRFLDDLERDWEFHYEARVADDYVSDFLETLPHIKGQWARRGEVFRLEPWQCFIECNLFGWLDENGLRRFRESYEEVARKNGKSFRLAGRGLYLFAASGSFGSEVYSGATTEAQAWEIFRPAREICRRHEEFREAFGIDVAAKSLAILENGSRFAPIIGKPGDGHSASGALVDEYHEHTSDALVDSMQTSMGARREPLLNIITTAGTDFGGPCYEKRQDVIKILERQVIDETVFGIIYSMDEGDEWDGDAAMIKANPNLDVSISRKFLEQQRAQARRSATRQNSYRTKHCCQWVGAKTAWMNMLAWQRQKRDLNLEDFAGKRAWLAVDLASKKDVCAIVILIDDGDRLVTLERFYAPENSAIENDRYRNYAASGHLELTQGSATDYGVIEEEILRLCGLFSVSQCGFDKWQAQYLMQRLTERGVPVIEFPHQVRTFSDPMKEVDARITDGTLVHDGNAMQTWMMGAVTAKQDAKENIYPNKEKPNDHTCKIDGPVALIMAMGLYLQARNEGSLDDFLANPVVV